MPATVNFFRVFANGDNFDVDAFLSTVPLVPDFVWRCGDVKRYSCIGSRHTSSGLELVLGDGETLPFNQQDGIACSYLASNREALRLLAAWPGVNSLDVSLQHNAIIDCSVVGFGLGVSPQLMWHCLDIGCRLSFFINLEREPDPCAVDIEGLG